MNIKSWNALLVIALVIVLSGGGYILYKNNEQKQIELAQEQAAAQEAAEQARQEKIEQAKRFEDFINDFLVGVAEEVNEYKKSRSVLKDLSEPENLREPAYIEENANLAENLVMSLQLQMDAILQQFDEANVQAQVLIGELDAEGREVVEAKWAKVRDENLETYTAFFAMEQDILMAHLALIEFYEAHKDVLSIDVANGHVLFEDVALQEEEALLRGRIIELRAEQQDVLKDVRESQ